MKKLYLLFLIVWSYAGVMTAQIQFDIDDTTGDPGGTVDVNFKVRDFNRIVGMQFSISWDPNILQFSNLSNVTNALRDFDAGAFNTDAKWTDQGNIIVQWFDSRADHTTLADGTTLFTVTFNVVGGSGSSTTITITDTPRQIEIIDSNEDNVGLNVSGGAFTASGQGSGTTVRLIGSDEVGETGENVCVEVSVQGFTNIIGMQFSINWDTEFLEYTGVNGFNLSGLSQGTFSEDDVSMGKLGLQWLDPASNGVTVGDGTRIFNICFNIKGTNGSRSVQFTNDPVAIEVVDGDDNRVTVSKKDGTVSVDDPGGGGSDCTAPGFALAMSAEQGETGSQVCVDIDVKGFSDITSIASTLEWDPAVLSNPKVQDFNLSGLDEGLFNLDMGSAGFISIVWIDQSTDGITLADGTRIFSLCFDIIGNDGQSSTVVFSDRQVEREVSIDGQAGTFNQCNGRVDVGMGNGNAIAVSSTAPSCPGESDGSINITMNAGTAPYTYAWTRGGTSVGTSEDLNNIAAGTYVVNVTDATGEMFSAEVILNDPSQITINNATVTDATDGANGQIELSLTGGATPLSFSWSNGATTRDIAGLTGGTYSVTITDANNCSIDASFTVAGGELTVTVTGENITCNGENDGTATASASGGAGDYTYQWSQGGNSQSISGLEGGTYTVTVTDAVGATAEASVEITEPNTLSVSIETTASPTNTEGTATAIVTGGTEPYTYSWSDADRQRTRLAVGLPQGPITVVVTDANGCPANASDMITSGSKECFTAVPVMTPNGDNRNDVFYLECVAGMDNEVEVYSRDGRLVFQASNYNNDWEGLDMDGQLLENGAYFWVVRVRMNGILEQHTGHLTILSSLN